MVLKCLQRHSRALSAEHRRVPEAVLVIAGAVLAWALSEMDNTGHLPHCCFRNRQKGGGLGGVRGV